MSPLIRLSACFVALMMAMGIGRFALTPQLPHLLSEGQIDLTAAGLIAAANYLGYLWARWTRCSPVVPSSARRLHGGLWLCAADPGIVLGQRFLGAFVAALRHRRGECLGAGDDYGAESALAAAAGRPRLAPWYLPAPDWEFF
jgi:hypothetical protein